MRTIFNFLGPLTNPAGAERQLLGVSDRHYQETIAEALVGLGSERAMVVGAEDGVDELSISARTRVIEVADGGTAEWFVEPGEFGLERGRAGGRRRRRPRSENAAVVARACSTASRARGATSSCSTPAPRSTSAAARPTSPRAWRRPRAAIDSGAAADVLERLDRDDRPRSPS